MARLRPQLQYFWAEPDASLTVQTLLEVAENLENMRKPMALAGRAARADIKERFQTGTDPEGRPWDPWAESYAPWALAHSTGRIFGDRANLHLSGLLEREVTRASRYIATSDELFIDVGNLPPYWAWNNFGATRRVSTRVEGSKSINKEYFLNRAKILITEERRAGRIIAPKAALQRVIQEQIQYAKGGNDLPARPFLGKEGSPALSVAAQAKITAIFDNWFVGVVAQAKASRPAAARTPDFATSARTGRTYYARRGPGGRFVKRS